MARHTVDQTPVESLGVPHTEVDLILVNDRSVEWAYQPQEGDRVAVYPVFESLDITPLIRLRPEPLREVRFVLDGHLGRLAAYLRMLGFDTWYRNHVDDAVLAQVSKEERRILLTRDQGLLKRSAVTHGYWVRATAPREQLREVIARFDLQRQAKPFTRCLSCNGRLQAASLAEVEGSSAGKCGALLFRILALHCVWQSLLARLALSAHGALD